MNKNIEAEIIKQFVIKNKQERIIWELSDAQKRKSVFWKFAGSDIFKNDCLNKLDNMSADELEQYLFKLGKTDDVYYIGMSYIGEISLKDAVKKVSDGEICVIYCGNGVGYYQGEQEKGAPPRYMLINYKVMD